jgi:hypothetical protein
MITCLTAPVPGPLTVQVDGDRLHLTIITDPEATTACAEIDAPAEATAELTRRHWQITVPAGTAGGGSIRVAAPGTPTTGRYPAGTASMTVTVPPGSPVTAQTGAAAATADHADQ